MNAGERSAENLIGAKQMINVSARMMLASITVALSVDRREVLAKASIADVDAAVKGVQSAVAGAMLPSNSRQVMILKCFIVAFL